jgi:hypothetical protein
MAISSLEDTVYELNYKAADLYIRPGARIPAKIGIGAARADHVDHGYMFFPN